MPVLTEKSLNKARWVMKDIAFDAIEKLARKHDMPEVVARFLLNRNIDEEAIETYLNPTLRNDFPDPFSMAGMRDMAADFAEVIATQKNIALFGDFDVDGATSSAVLYRFLKACGINAPVYIPDRLTEGYGPNIEALESLKTQGAEIIIFLDCGTAANDIVTQANDMGLQIYIFDHHEPGETLPDAAHLINPKRRDDKSSLDMLAAVGVTFMACVAVNKALREKEFFDKSQPEPDLKSLLDLVALGTVCDMVPLTGPNRLFVKAGFRADRPSMNTGLKALCSVAKVSPPITPYHAGFILGPRINAGSRVHQADLGARLLCSEDSEEAVNMAWTLEDCNAKRKTIQKRMEQGAIARLEKMPDLDERAVLIVDDEDWHPGLSGLVAGRLKEKYGKPACVVTYADNADGTKEGRGSGRSVPGVHIAESFMAAHEAGLLVKGGGHAMAGGFTILPEQLDAFKDFMDAHVREQLKDLQSHVETNIEGVLAPQGVQPGLVKLLEEGCGPFGQDNPEPLFLLRNMRVFSADILGEQHIRLMIGGWEGGTRIKAMAFRAVDTALGQAFLKHGRKSFDICGYLKLNCWQGRESAEFHIKDAVFTDTQGNQDAAAQMELQKSNRIMA